MPDGLGELLERAREHLRAGRFGLASEAARQVLDAAPDEAEAYHLVGLAGHLAGGSQEAVPWLERAVALAPTWPEYRSNLSAVLAACGRTAEAELAARAAIELCPDHPSAYFNLANAVYLQGRPSEAEQRLRQALASRPEFWEASFRLAEVLRTLGRLEEAAAQFRLTASLRPDDPGPHLERGRLLYGMGHLDDALEALGRAVALAPNDAGIENDRGMTLQSMGRLDRAQESFRRVIDIDPGFAPAHNNLGNMLLAQGRLAEAAASYQRAIAREPDHAHAWNNLGIALKGQGRLDEAIEAYRRARRLAPGHPGIHSNWLYALHFHPDSTPASLAAAHAEWDRVHAQPLAATWRRHDRDADPQRPLRIGFVSADFGDHPMGYFFLRVLQSLRGEACHTVCYSNAPRADAMAGSFASAAGAWRDIWHLSDEAAADLVRADRIDILMDLAGHAAGNRLLLFARKPTPVQVTCFCYPGTTGLAAMDYIITDRHAVPEGDECHFREQVIRLEQGPPFFLPESGVPDVGPLPVIAHGHVTFGSFNHPAKITAQVVEVWSRILHRVPGSRLVLKYRGMDDPHTRQRYEELFAAQGVEAGHIEFQGQTPLADMLACYNQIDIALDPFPYTGSTTTCFAVWMGVPVVTCAGQTLASRQSLSHLSTAGITETIARDLAEYVEIAVRLAGDLDSLGGLRRTLRNRMARSPLCDPRHYGQQFWTACRGMWRRWCAQGGTGDKDVTRGTPSQE